MRPTPTLQTRERIRNSLKGRSHTPERVAAIARGRRVRYPVIQKNQRFSSWTVIGDPITAHNQTKYLCRCVCGIEKYIAASHLRLAKSKQCIKCNGKSNTTRSFTRNKTADGKWLYGQGRGRRAWVKEMTEEFYVSQKGICPICQATLREDLSDACVDHCHTTGIVRGLIHRGCNVLVGWFDRDPTITERIPSYLGWV